MIIAPIKITHQVLAILITLLFTIPNASEFIIAQVRLVYSHRPGLVNCAEEPTQHPDSYDNVAY